MAKGHSRHKEYSLILAVIAALLVGFLGATNSLALLVVLNLLAVAAILWSAFSVVRHADVLAHRFGEPFGSLILSLSIVVLEISLISILMLSGSAGETLMRDTVYSVIIIVMAGLTGFALLIGGWRYKTQEFNLAGIRHYLISIIPLSIIVFVLPAVLDGGYSKGQRAMVAVVCLLIYGAFLKLQTQTHRQFFVFEHEDEDASHHGKPSTHSTAWHTVFLIIHLIAVISVTKMNSYPLTKLLASLSVPPAFTGFLVAFLILTPEGLGAFSSIISNQVQRAMNLLLGSVLATISLTVPTVLLIAALTGQETVMALESHDIILLLATFLVCQTSLVSGRTNAHSGMAHVIIFLVYVMLLFR